MSMSSSFHDEDMLGMPDDEPGPIQSSSSFHSSSNHSHSSSVPSSPIPRPVSPDNSVSTAHASNTSSRARDRDRPWRTKGGGKHVRSGSNASGISASSGSSYGGGSHQSHGGLGMINTSRGDPSLGGSDILGDLTDLEVEQKLNESAARRAHDQQHHDGQVPPPPPPPPPRTITPRESTEMQQQPQPSSSAILGRIKSHRPAPVSTTTSTVSTVSTVGTRTSSSSGLADPTKLPTPVASSGDARWKQFDTPDLGYETAKANAAAIASAAESAASRHSSSSGGGDDGYGGGNVMVLDVPPPPPPPPPPARPTMSGGRPNSSRSNSTSNGNGSAGRGGGGMLGKAAGSLRNLMKNPSSPEEQERLEALEAEREPGFIASRSRSAAATATANSASNRHSISPHDAVRLQALQMLQLAGGADDEVPRVDSIRRTRGGGYSTNPPPGMASPSTTTTRGHEPASIAGLDMSLTAAASDQQAAKNNQHDQRFEIDDDDHQDRVARGVASPPMSPGTQTHTDRELGLDFLQQEPIDNDNDNDNEDNEVSFEEEDNLAAMAAASRNASEEGSNKSSWSSRYSVDRQLMFLTGGQNPTSVLNDMDYAHRRTTQDGRSATGMYRSSAYNMKSSGSSSRAASNQRDRAHRGTHRAKSPRGTLWMDVDLSSPRNAHDQHSLPEPPHHSQVGNYLISDEIRRTRRRRLCVGGTLLVALAAIIGTLYGTTFGGNDESAANYWNVGEEVTFMVTSDVPYNQGEEEKLARQLTELPGEAEFVVHLGDLGLASSRSCAQSVYEDASSILKTSKKPVFVLPGNNDWNDCPNPDAAFGHWMDNFRGFEDNFQHSIEVTRQLGREENFSFLQNGVLFIGLNLVNGNVPDRRQWDLRHQENVQWTEQQLAQFDREEYRAVVILGHARPTTDMGDYFWPIINDVNDAYKPVLYVHANDDNGWELYQPFSDAGLMQAMELDKGGNAPPVKIKVEFGGRPFRFDRRI